MGYVGIKIISYNSDFFGEHKFGCERAANDFQGIINKLGSSGSGSMLSKYDKNCQALFRQFSYPPDLHKNEFCFVHNRHLTMTKCRGIDKMLQKYQSHQ